MGVPDLQRPFFFFATSPCYSGQCRVGDVAISIAVKRQLQGIGPGKAATSQGTVDRHGLNNSDTNGATVDGLEIRRAPIEVGSLSHYLQGFIHTRWLAGFLPSTECHNFCGLRFVLYKMMAVGCSSKSTTIPNVTVLIYLAAGLGDVTSLCWMHDHFSGFPKLQLMKSWKCVGKIPYVIPELYFIHTVLTYQSFSFNIPRGWSICSKLSLLTLVTRPCQAIIFNSCSGHRQLLLPTLKAVALIAAMVGTPVVAPMRLGTANRFLMCCCIKGDKFERWNDHWELGHCKNLCLEFSRLTYSMFKKDALKNQTSKKQISICHGQGIIHSTSFNTCMLDILMLMVTVWATRRINEVPQDLQSHLPFRF